MEKRARAVGAHRELVVDDANHKELCARCHLVPLPLSLPLPLARLRPCCIDCARLAKSMLDCFGEALRDRVRVVQARLLARYPKAYRASRRDKTLPRDGTREPFELVKCLRAKGRNPHDHAARRSQPQVRLGDRFHRAVEAHSAHVCTRSDAERPQFDGDERR